MITPRVQRLKDRFLSVRPNITPERLLLITEAYKRFAGEPRYLFRAKTLEYVLDHLSITIHDEEMIVGVPTYTLRGALLFPEYSSTEWLLEEIPEFPTRKLDEIDVTEEDKKIIMDCLEEFWQGRAIEDHLYEILPEDTMAMYENSIIDMGQTNTISGEVVPNYKRLMEQGFKGYIARCEEKIAETKGDTIEAQEKIDFWRGCIITAEAVIRFANRYADKALELAEQETDMGRKAELLEIASNCRNVPENPPRGFYEALQFVWFVHLVYHIEGPATACSFGRFDQILYPYMELDMNAGVFDEDKAQEILECFFLKCGEVIEVRDKECSKAFAGFPMWAIVMVGGLGLDGEDATNKLSYMCLTAGADVRTAQPVLAMRVSEKTPEDLLHQAAEMIQDGMAQPGLFNDDVNMKIVRSKGGTDEEVLGWNVVGCTQPQYGGGGADCFPDVGYVNYAKCLEFVLHRGVDPRTGMKLGIDTGDPCEFTCKEDIIEACKKQIIYIHERMVEASRIIQVEQARRLPAVYTSLTVDDCIEKGMSVQEGGAKHSSSGIFGTGQANLADSIVGIEYAVFKDKLVTMQELIDILDSDFKDNERIRQYLINIPPKFGNDDPYVDAINKDICTYVAETVQGWKDARGGHYDYTLMSQSENVPHGEDTGATPDGRHAGESLNDNSSPMMGRDINGPTATVKSVASLKPEHFYAGALFNLRFDPKSVEGEKGIDTIESVVKTYFKEGGQHIQINVVDDATLRAAQENPEEYRGLVVRVAGYLAYFTELDRHVQDSIIARTAHSGC